MKSVIWWSFDIHLSTVYQNWSICVKNWIINVMYKAYSIMMINCLLGMKQEKSHNLINIFFFFQTLPVDDMRIWRKNKIHKMNILISSNSNGGDSTNVLQHRQISSTTRPNTIMRTPDHYEMIDQIGKGEITYNILFS